MTDKQTAPYGSWVSPISPALAAGGVTRPAEILVSEDTIYWAESRPKEGGRVAIVRKMPGADPTDAIPDDFNCRTRVHEYGGGAFLADGATLYASKFEDQRLYRIEDAGDPIPITPEPEIPAGLRYADGRLIPDRSWIVCVRERHVEQGPPHNEIVALSPDGSADPTVIVSGRDFYAYPRPNPIGDRLAWLEWDQPNMPWDGTELWVGDLSKGGKVSNKQRMAGGPEESIYQPEWSPEGTLHFVSDRSGWWNLYRSGNAEDEPIAPRSAEFGSPLWTFGRSQYTFLPDGRILCLYAENGIDQLALASSSGVQTLDTGYSSFYPRSLHYAAAWERAVFVAANPREHPRVYAMDLDSGEIEPLSDEPGHMPDPGYVSEPQPIQFPTAGGGEAHALYYPPSNRDFDAPESELPPLLVVSHGGPTSNTNSEFFLPRQFMSSRGFAIVDVDYRGSTGYGREYRRLLNGEWGVADVEDCINAAKYLIERGDADPERVAIRGGSAGGYATLCALTFHDFFTAGASYYGIGDLETLVTDDHKFEARYLDSLIGPYPEASELYRARSPIHFTERLSAPLILLQGGEDRVVPPAQAELMAQALQAKELPYAYLLFEQEGHGFRASENIQRSLEAELYFYSKIFGFELGEPIEPIEIHNL